MKTWSIEPAEGGLSGACACCSGEPGLRGFVFEDGVPAAVYFVEPIGVFGRPMIKLGIAVGEWSSGSPASRRVAFVLTCKPAGGEAELVPTEPKMLSFPELAMLGRRLDAQTLAAHASFDEFVALARAIIAQDWRLEAVRSEEPPRPRRRFSADAADS